MASRRFVPATFKRPMKPGANRGLQEALQALYGPAPGLTPEDILAERERVRVEDDARKQRQAVLHLVQRDSQ